MAGICGQSYPGHPSPQVWENPQHEHRGIFLFHQICQPGNIFDGKAIWEGKSPDGGYAYRKLQGKYPVIFMGFADVKPTNSAGMAALEEMKAIVKQIIANEYKKYKEIMASNLFSDDDRAHFASVNRDMDDLTASMSIMMLCSYLEKILWSKYALSFSIPMFEDEFIKNEFNTPQNIIMYHRMVDGFFPNVAPIKLTANVVNPLNLSNALEKLMLTRNYYFYNPDQMLGIRFLACSIRASIVMLDDNEAKIIIDKINNAIKVLMNVKDTELIVKTLQNIIDSREADKEKLQIVTFRR